MNSLTESILRHQQEEKRKKARDIIESKDELGLPTFDEDGRDLREQPAYAVARALIRDRQRPDWEEDTVHRLHLRHGEIHRGCNLITEESQSFYILTGFTTHKVKALQYSFWEKLKEVLPVLDTNVIKVGEGVYWDKRSGKLCSCSYQDIIERLKKEEK